MNQIQNFNAINNNKVLFSSIKMYAIDNINKEKSKKRMHSMRKKDKEDDKDKEKKKGCRH